jgi:Cof subfamily protein (haloacid dehalogenase superfamily)
MRRYTPPMNDPTPTLSTVSTKPSPRGWRIVACDLDGTLIGRDNQAHPTDVDALKRARAAGIHVAICTGRNTLECGTIVTALDLSGPGVFANGAMVSQMETGKSLMRTAFPTRLIAPVVDFLGTQGHAVLGLVDDPTSQRPAYWLTNHAPPHRATLEWQLHHKTHSRIVADFPEEILPHVVRLSIVVNVADGPALVTGLNDRFGDALSLYSIYSTYFDCQVIEILHAGVSKWAGLLQLAALLDVAPEQIVTIGDDVNDIEMLRGAALSFAMGNATPAIQQCAKRITLHQKENGVAAAIDGILNGDW